MLARVALATLAAVPVGAFVQAHVAFDIVSLEDQGAWAPVLWPAVLLGLGLAAAALVALPVSAAFGLLRRRTWTFPARIACESLVGTVLFRVVSFPISQRDTLLMLLPQLVFFGVFHAFGRERAAAGERPGAGAPQRP